MKLTISINLNIEKNQPKYLIFLSAVKDRWQKTVKAERNLRHKIKNTIFKRKKEILFFRDLSEQTLSEYKKIKNTVKHVFIYCTGYEDIPIIDEKIHFEFEKTYFFLLEDIFSLTLDNKTTEYILSLVSSGQKISISVSFNRTAFGNIENSCFSKETIHNILKLLDNDLLEIFRIPEKAMKEIFTALTEDIEYYSKYEYKKVVKLMKILLNISKLQMPSECFTESYPKCKRREEYDMGANEYTRKLRVLVKMECPDSKILTENFFEFLCYFNSFPLLDLINIDFYFYEKMAKKYINSFMKAMEDYFFFGKYKLYNNVDYKNHGKLFSLYIQFIDFENIRAENLYFVFLCKEFCDVLSEEKMLKLMDFWIHGNYWFYMPYLNTFSENNPKIIWSGILQIIKKITSMDKEKAMDFYLNLRELWEKKPTNDNKDIFYSTEIFKETNNNNNPFINTVMPILMNLYHGLDVGEI